MRCTWVGLAAVVLAAAAASAAEGDAATMGQLLDEVRALRNDVEALTERVGELSDHLDRQDEGPMMGAPHGLGLRFLQDMMAAGAMDGMDGLPMPLEDMLDFEGKGADTAALSKIELPEDPTEEQARDYVASIMAASAEQTFFSSRNPQGRMLARVGSEHLGVLLEVLAEDSFGRMYVTYAIKRLAREEHKDLVLEVLPFHHGLLEVVLDHGWQRDAKDILVAELEVGSPYLSHAWVEAVAGLRDPGTYDVLRNHLIYGTDRELTHRAIVRLPDIDLADAVAEAWTMAQVEGENQALSMAKTAVRYGHVDALGILIDFLNGPDGQALWGQDLRRTVLRHAEAKGTNAELLEWYERNIGNLVFDEKAKVFRVAEPE